MVKTVNRDRRQLCGAGNAGPARHWLGSRLPLSKRRSLVGGGPVRLRAACGDEAAAHVPRIADDRQLRELTAQRRPWVQPQVLREFERLRPLSALGPARALLSAGAPALEDEVRAHDCGVGRDGRRHRRSVQGKEGRAHRRRDRRRNGKYLRSCQTAVAQTGMVVGSDGPTGDHHRSQPRADAVTPARGACSGVRASDRGCGSGRRWRALRRSGRPGAARRPALRRGRARPVARGSPSACRSSASRRCSSASQ